MKKTTDELLTELGDTSSLQQFLLDNEAAFQEKDAAELISSMIAGKKIKKTTLAERSGMSEVYLHQILSGTRKASRNKLVCLCIGIGAGLESTQELLKCSGNAILYPKSRRDAVIMYGLLHKMELSEVNDLLFDAGEDTLL